MFMPMSASYTPQLIVISMFKKSYNGREPMYTRKHSFGKKMRFRCLCLIVVRLYPSLEFPVEGLTRTSGIPAIKATLEHDGC